MDKLEKIEKELDNFINDGLTGGFHFDEECGLELSKIQKDIKEIFDKQSEQNRILTEQLDISQALHKKEFDKAKNYEKALFAILNTVSEEKQARLIDIISNTVNGHDFIERYKKDSKKGKVLFKNQKGREK